ncbi:MAG: hypothetical protein C0391_01735 [Anaerolinea sp.]|nr:hypothetical protein [Anaerolinea sp.]
MIDNGLFLIMLAFLLVLLLSIFERKKVRSNFRVIPSFEQYQRAIHNIIESGEGAHITLGSGSILSPQAGSTLAAVELLANLSRLCLNSDTAPLATSGDGVVYLLALETMRSTNRAMRFPHRSNINTTQITGVSPFSYIAGAMLAQRYDHRALAVALGSFGPEVGLLADSAERIQAHTTSGTDNLLAQAVLYATNRSPLIGEEFFAASAYSQPDPVQAASLKTQDILRLMVVAAILIGAILKVAGKL